MSRRKQGELSEPSGACKFYYARSLAVRFSAACARRRMPRRAAVFALEMRARDERLSQISRIVDDRRDDEPAIAVWLRRDEIEIFGERRASAVGHAVDRKS